MQQKRHSLATIAAVEGQLDYKIVTQVVVTLEAGHCSPVNVAELVSQQVGFEVVLLDSKCLPVIESDTTTGADYWKSNHKILAASNSLYKRLIGSSSKRANDDVDLTNSDQDIGSHPKSKCCCVSDNRLDKILEVVERIQEKNDFVEKISGLFECIIVKDVTRRPQFSPCCNRAVGCQACLTHLATQVLNIH